MRVIIKEGFDYIPMWNNNKKAKKAEQIVVHFKFLSGANFSDLIDENGKTDKKAEWLTTCESVENLFINDVEVNPEGIYTIPGLMDLYIELRLAYNRETTVDKKKL